MKNSNKGFGFIGLLVVLAVIAAGSWLAVKNVNTIKNSIAPNATSSSAIDLAKEVVQKIEQRSNSETQSKTSVSTTGWKTYRNDKYGYEFNYPPQYIVNTTSFNDREIAIGDPKARVFLSLMIGPEVDSEQEFYGRMAPDISVSKVIGEKTYMAAFRNAVDGGGYSTEVLTWFDGSTHKGLNFIISGGGDVPGELLISQFRPILDSFKFTK